MNHHYTFDDVVSSLKKIGLKKGDVVFSHSNIGFLGIPKGGHDPNNAFETILNAFFEVIGSQGTLIVPTFTYSFSQGRIFDPNETPSDCGVFTELLRKSKNSLRSHDPSVSVAAIGNKAEEMTSDLPENAYDEDSFFGRFYKADGIVCNINFDAGSTFVHYVERMLKVPYRFDKTFSGQIRWLGKILDRCSTIWVRYLDAGTEARFELFSKLAEEKKMYQKDSIGRGFIGAIKSSDVFDLINQTLPKMPLFLTEAGAQQ